MGPGARPSYIWRRWPSRPPAASSRRSPPRRSEPSGGIPPRCLPPLRSGAGRTGPKATTSPRGGLVPSRSSHELRSDPHQLGPEPRGRWRGAGAPPDVSPPPATRPRPAARIARSPPAPGRRATAAPPPEEVVGGQLPQPPVRSRHLHPLGHCEARDLNHLTAVKQGAAIGPSELAVATKPIAEVG